MSGKDVVRLKADVGSLISLVRILVLAIFECMTTLASTLAREESIFSQNRSASWSNSLLSNRWAYHIVFWMFVFLFNAAYISFIGEDRDVSLYNLGLRIPFILLCCYVNLYWLMPKFYYSGQFVSYGGMVLALIFSLNALNLYLLELFVESPICPTTFEADATFNGSNYIYKSFYLFSLVGLTSGIKLSKRHLTEKQKADAIEKEKLQTELSLLKSQINPHFFFNTLNNLYALSIKKSDQAPEMVLKLSELMSYSLYESDGANVSLDKEIKHIQNYIELESIRLANKMKVEFSVTGSPTERQIPPLIFLPIIENCFKHTNTRQVDSVIRIKIIVSQHSLVLKTENPAVHEQQPFNRKGGLGLRNLKRRLALLYETRYALTTELANGQYSVVLEIPAA